VDETGSGSCPVASLRYAILNLRVVLPDRELVINFCSTLPSATRMDGKGSVSGSSGNHYRY
jgi:hypothetical protein